MEESSRVARFLKVHSKIGDVNQNLHVTLRLHTASHQSVAHERFSIFEQKSGNDGVERSFARGIDIGVPLLQGEQLATILQHKTKASRDESGSHTAVVRLNERHHHPLAVDNG